MPDKPGHVIDRAETIAARAEERPLEAEVARKEHEDRQRAQDEKSATLKALWLAKEAQRQASWSS